MRRDNTYPQLADMNPEQIQGIINYMPNRNERRFVSARNRRREHPPVHLRTIITTSLVTAIVVAWSIFTFAS